MLRKGQQGNLERKGASKWETGDSHQEIRAVTTRKKGGSEQETGKFPEDENEELPNRRQSPTSGPQGSGLASEETRCRGAGRGGAGAEPGLAGGPTWYTEALGRSRQTVQHRTE